MGTTRDYLLDTGILVLYARASSAGEAIEDRFHFRDSPFKPMVSVVTLGEARAFARYRSWGEKKVAQLEGILRNVVPIDVSSAEVLGAYAEIHAVATSQRLDPGRQRYMDCRNGKGNRSDTLDHGQGL